jgi:hypothetical protein
MEQVGAIILEIESLAGGVGRDRDAQRVVRGVGVEGLLDFLAAAAVAALQRPHPLSDAILPAMCPETAELRIGPEPWQQIVRPP